MSLHLFYSYSHKDEKLREALETHLSILKRQGKINGWSDRKIAPGANWEEEIDSNLLNADIVLLLVSSNFLASDYCYETETIFALEQHKKGRCIVIPIIVKPCLWTESNFSHLQALPKNGKPISTWKNKDEAWLDVAQGLLKILPKAPKLTRVLEQKVSPESVNHSFIIMPILSVTGRIIRLIGKGFQALQSFDEAARLVLGFLAQYQDLCFSASRIVNWGRLQDGYEKLSELDTNSVAVLLKGFHRQGFVELIKSRKGNSLYQFIPGKETLSISFHSDDLKVDEPDEAP